jgi:hypothetical protein
MNYRQYLGDFVPELSKTADSWMPHKPAIGLPIGKIREQGTCCCAAQLHALSLQFAAQTLNLAGWRKGGCNTMRRRGFMKTMVAPSVSGQRNAGSTEPQSRFPIHRGPADELFRRFGRTEATGNFWKKEASF